jgi:hypothetical protein
MRKYVLMALLLVALVVAPASGSFAADSPGEVWPSRLENTDKYNYCETDFCRPGHVGCCPALELVYPNTWHKWLKVSRDFKRNLLSRRDV